VCRTLPRATLSAPLSQNSAYFSGFNSVSYCSRVFGRAWVLVPMPSLVWPERRKSTLIWTRYSYCRNHLYTSSSNWTITLSAQARDYRGFGCKSLRRLCLEVHLLPRQTAPITRQADMLTPQHANLRCTLRRPHTYWRILERLYCSTICFASTKLQ
jgi:hypothetical protein